MAKRGPKSAAEKNIKVLQGGAPPRPVAPDEFNDDELAIWDKVIRTEPPGFFSTEALQALLADYCRHRVASDRLSATISSFKPEWLKMEEGAARYDRLLRMRDRESKAVLRCATKLRITNQARYTPAAAATAVRNDTQRVAKPWEA